MVHFPCSVSTPNVAPAPAYTKPARQSQDLKPSNAPSPPSRASPRAPSSARTRARERRARALPLARRAPTSRSRRPRARRARRAHRRATPRRDPTVAAPSLARSPLRDPSRAARARSIASTNYRPHLCAKSRTDARRSSHRASKSSSSSSSPSSRCAVRRGRFPVDVAGRVSDAARASLNTRR